MNLYLKTLISKVKSCDFKRIVNIINNKNKFDNN